MAHGLIKHHQITEHLVRLLIHALLVFGVWKELAKIPHKSSPEVAPENRTVVKVNFPEHDSQWATIVSMSSKVGCSAETRRKWVRQAD